MQNTEVARTYTFHEGIDLYKLAAPLAATKFCLIEMPDVNALLPFIRGNLRHKWRALIIVYQHFLLMLRLYRHSHDYDLLLVRDFLSLPLLCVIWLALPLRKKACFINTHNLQKAVTHKTQRIAFIALCKLGFKIALQEGADGLEQVGIKFDPKQFFFIPHIALASSVVPAHKVRKKVGIIGVYRPEKGMARLIPCLLELQKHYDIDAVIGTPDVALLKQHIDTRENKIEIIDTTSGEAYAQTLASCDIVLFNYTKEDYYFRDSGVITNAVECGASVLCPDFPIFHHQVFDPKPIGDVFKNESDIISVAGAILEKRNELFNNRQDYFNYRSPQSIADHIDRFARLNDLI